MEDVSKINQADPIHPDKPGLSSHDQKRQKKRGPFREARKHYDELIKIVDETHDQLEKNNSPFRICVYQEGEDVYIDIVAIDESGKIRQVFKHDISHVELEELIQHLKTGRGLILDADV